MLKKGTKMKIKDIGDTFQCPGWTEQEKEKFLAAISQHYSPIKAVFEEDYDTGIHLGSPVVVMIQKTYVDRNCKELDVCEKGKFYFQRDENDEEWYKPYHGKLYDGYEIAANRSVLFQRYRDLEIAASVAIACYETIQDLNERWIYEIKDKETRNKTTVPEHKVQVDGRTYITDIPVEIDDKVLLPTPSWLSDVKGPTFEGIVTSLNGGDWNGTCSRIIKII